MLMMCIISSPNHQRSGGKRPTAFDRWNLLPAGLIVQATGLLEVRVIFLQIHPDRPEPDVTRVALQISQHSMQGYQVVVQLFMGLTGHRAPLEDPFESGHQRIPQDLWCVTIGGMAIKQGTHANYPFRCFRISLPTSALVQRYPNGCRSILNRSSGSRPLIRPLCRAK